MEPIIKLKDISKKFTDSPGRPLHVLECINLTINRGELFLLVGASGSGKSTLLRIMCGLEKKYEGTVELSPDVTHKDISFVFQQFGLLPWLTVGQNVELNLISRNMPEHERKKKVTDELSQLGLLHFKNTYPRDLSGGMRQRVGIARALASDPKIIFMDEPFSELDSFTASELRADILKIWRERGVTVIMVTHIIPDAVELATRIAVLSPRPGKIRKIIENKLDRPRNSRSEAFFTYEDEVINLLHP